MQINLLCLIVGIIPYTIKRHLTKDEQVFIVKALVWRLTVRKKEGRHSWELYVPFIEHLRQ